MVIDSSDRSLSRANWLVSRWFTLAVSTSLFLAKTLWAADGTEPAYRIANIEYPKDISMEVGGLAILPGGKLAAATRRGEIWVADHPYVAEGSDPQWHRFASGLHEPLGLAYRDGALYTTQRSEVTKLRDTDGDGIADEYLCAAKGWGVSGAYHEYAYGPKFDPLGNMWVTLNCTMGTAMTKEKDWRGYSLRITPDGQWRPISGGMRSPSGIGINASGDVFYSEQQGNWNCAGGVHHIRQGAFHGHADSFASASLPGAPFAKPEKPVSKLLVPEAARQMPIYKPAAVWLPYRKMGMSCTDLALDNTGGKFGPFDGQFFVGEFTMSQINRVFLEKVGGEYQGACFPFMEGFQSAPLRMEFGEDGSMFVGQTNRGWNSLGSRSYGLQRVLWNGRVPFEMKTVEALPTGFRCTFTKPFDRTSVASAKWIMSSYAYEYHADYGGPDMDVQDLAPEIAAVAPNNTWIELRVAGLRAGYVHEFHLAGLIAQDRDTLAHGDAYYTLNKIPVAEPK